MKKFVKGFIVTGVVAVAGIVAYALCKSAKIDEEFEDFLDDEDVSDCDDESEEEDEEWE